MPGFTQLEATTVQIMLAGTPVKVLAAYLSPSRPLIGTDMDACFGGGLPVLMAGDLNAKHVDWTSWPSTRRGKLLRDYADGNSCLIFGPDSPTTNPYNVSHIRALTASFDSRLADVGNPLVRQLGRYLLWPRVGPVARCVNRE